MAGIRKRGRCWYLDWYENGTRHKRSLGAVSRDEAERQLDILKLRLKTGFVTDDVTGEPRRLTIAEFIHDEYLPHQKTTVTPATYKRGHDALALFLADYGRTAMADWSSSIVERHLAKRSRSVKASTVNRDRAVIMAAFNKAKKWGLVTGTIQVEKRKELDSKVPEFYSRANLEALYEIAGERAAWWRFMVNTGLRRTEALRAHRDWIRGAEIYVESSSKERTKSGRYRIVPLSEGAQKALEGLGGAYLLPRMRPDSLGQAFKRDAARAALPGSLHWLRHTFCSQLINTHNVSLPVVQQLAGHADIKTTMRYVKPSVDALRSGVSRLDL